ncbi:hypothetical protein [Companilactobacillus mishanensis]|uniref:Uncharacterized protein n=1 Tax=Companilactobacillus mishanensis TaxID=2486008 RepID=A0A5P0ZF07_9LACO|nr:hypothetical protein [Companilactobacillus mishanensis]MQS44263.1 hypothetical protein [Companilactobacillus mishanensis]MQS51634.1 hypothetical protein [Companilactobacillus mishanensis]
MKEENNLLPWVRQIESDYGTVLNENVPDDDPRLRIIRQKVAEFPSESQVDDQGELVDYVGIQEALDRGDVKRHIVQEFGITLMKLRYSIKTKKLSEREWLRKRKISANHNSYKSNKDKLKREAEVLGL